MTPWEHLLDQQCGVVSRTQCLQAGMSTDAVAWRLENGDWRRFHPGVYVTHQGPVSTSATCWAAVLFSGRGAALSHETAAWLWGFHRYEPPVRISVPHTRRVAATEGLLIVRSRRLDPARHQATGLPCTSEEETVLDLVDDAADLDRVLGVIADATQKRITNTFRLQEAASRRRKLRWRAEVDDVLGDVQSGAETPLEVAYLRRVERAHRLPQGRRQAPARVDGRSRFLDVLYDAYGTVVELDGRLGHDDARARFRDMRRDNAAAEIGRLTLRYGWRDVLGQPCTVAGQVGQVLGKQGWSGGPQRCGGSCGL